MNEIQYIGENLRPGQLGHFFVIFSFVMSLFSALSYFMATRTEVAGGSKSKAWIFLGRNGFILHAASILGIFITLYFIISNHLFEYQYAWEHSSRALPMKYLLSCFWEGQEGSFLLWSFWHAVLGIVVMYTSKGMESRVMAIIAIVQVALASMVLGFQFTEAFKIGSTPFLLLRDKMDAPIFAQANYLSLIKDGNGLNVLLQNYWMVIHPPILFLGFATTLIPFAYTIAALWKNDYETWIKPTRIWASISGGMLGLGIMLGGAWAYESLTFGGYWAWDPVENASLVPWLTLIAGLHTLIVFKATKRSLPVTLIFLSLTYVFVWYSTFLTRTGVLGDTSVHAFTGEGKSLYWHLIIVIGFILILSIGWMVKRWKTLPRMKTEEATGTREFWMFIGSFVLLLSALQISISTSIPVWSPLAKWISGKDIAPPSDPVTHYNNIQIWVAIIVAILSAAGLYLKFKKSDMKTFWKRIAIIGGISVAATIAIAVAQKISGFQYNLLLLSSMFAIIANSYYAFGIQKKLKKMGPAISHLGFALLLLGIFISSYNKEVISLNTLGVTLDFGKKTQQENAIESRENSILFLNTPVAMSEYMVTYKGDSSHATDPRTFFKVNFDRYDTATQKIVESFTLYPNAFINPKGQEGLMANPSSKHYLTRDIFTYITSAIDPSKVTDTASYVKHTLKKGDTVYLANGYLVFEDFEDANLKENSGALSVKARLKAYDLKGEAGVLKPVYSITEDAFQNFKEDTLRSFNVFAKFVKVNPADGTIDLMIKQKDPKDDYVVLKAFIFPYINLVWLGIIVMFLGFMLTAVNKILKKEKHSVV